MSFYKGLSAALVALAISGCAATSSTTQNDEDRLLPLVVPASINYKNELQLARLNEMLHSDELDQNQRVRFMYERGVLYDRLGLRTMARLDFHQVVKIAPDLADAYNFIGIYFTQDREFSSAFEAFDAVLELAPEYDYAYLNRGIALYYADRVDLSVEDMTKFLEFQPADGYRALWLYLAESKKDEAAAMANLIENRKALDTNKWDAAIVDRVLGKINTDELFTLAKKDLTYPNQFAERMCEAYFYLGKLEQAKGNYKNAVNLFKLTLGTNVHDFVEYRYARIELENIRNELAEKFAKLRAERAEQI
ncbi:lipoprotein NlpI [Paraferrimonas sedimenticola]|uniref:Lipoprotein NlpI n=1 Tax=Paraferrimonas sedimenticola TaxID=375674 RepID=A0AA37RX96_9GAMM|nr:lipoprotein NlpI [Paraferrimonas sedimenticola]GLP97008.1 lipoprotein NlpI [Paraferrimonas sedimenticola]